MTGCFNRLLNLRETKIDDRRGPNQTHIMKYLSHLSVATAAAFSLVFFAAPRAGAETAAKETRLGPFSAQKVAIAKHVGGARQRHSDNPNEPPTIAIVLTVEQKMTGNQQEITARISAHREGPGGPLVGVEGMRVHVTQPGEFGTQPQKVGEARATQTFSAPGGKYKTVVAEGSINSSRYTDVKMTLTIPGN
jgi:hypothetical protein